MNVMNNFGLWDEPKGNRELQLQVNPLKGD